MRRYRVRITLIIAALMLAVQAVLLMATYVNGAAVRKKVVEESFDNHVKELETRVETRFEMLDAIQESMSNTACTVFTESSTGVLPRVERERYADVMGDYIDSLDIPNGLVDTVVILGKTYDKVGYIKKIGGRGMVSESLPTMSHLRFVDIDRWNDPRQVQWDFIHDSDLIETYEKNLKEKNIKVSDGIRKSVNFFLTLLDDHIVVSWPTSMGGSRIFMLLQPDFLSAVKERETVQYALFHEGIPVYSSNNYSTLGAKIAEKDTTWDYVEGNRQYRNRSVTLKNDQFELFVSEPITYKAFMSDMPRYIYWIPVVSVGISILFGFVACSLLFLPFQRLKRTFETQFKNGNYQRIEEKKRRPAIRLSMFYQVFSVFLISLLVPLLLSGVYYQKLLHQYVRNINHSYLKDLTGILCRNVEDREKYILLASANLPQNELSSFLNSSGEATVYLQTGINNAYRSGGQFGHYALFDAAGIELFHTKTSSGRERLILNPEDRIQNRQGTRTCYLTMVVDNSTISHSRVPAVVYPISINGKGEIDGYFVLYVNMNHFYELRPGVGHEFILYDRQGHTVFSTVADLRDRRKLIEEAGKDALSESDFVAISMEESVNGGQVATYNDFRVYKEQQKALSGQLVVVIMGVGLIVVITALTISRQLTGALTKLMENMSSIRSVREIAPVRYQGNDEISGLVDSYNRMVDRMAALIAENASRINRENELLAINSRTQLQMLQQQINPHLLYNTLEFISYNAKREGSSVAGDMAVALADLFRYTTSVKEDIVRFHEELKHIQNYIHIHQLRYGERFEVRYRIAPEAMEVKILKFVLQPFVENVFKYGIANKLHGALVEIDARVEADKLILAVSDNGVGIRRAKLEQIRGNIELLLHGKELPNAKRESEGGVGMTNVTRRLYMYYRTDAHVEIKSEFMHGFQVIITIPINPKEKESDGEK